MSQRATAIRQRSAREVFEDHLKKRQQGQLEEDITLNYSEDVVLLTGSGIHLGHDGVRECTRILQEYLPEANYDYRTKLVKAEFAFLEWSGTSKKGIVCDGADSYVIRNGFIVAQTIHYRIKVTATGDDSDQD